MFSVSLCISREPALTYFLPQFLPQPVSHLHQPAPHSQRGCILHQHPLHIPQKFSLCSDSHVQSGESGQTADSPTQFLSQRKFSLPTV